MKAGLNRVLAETSHISFIGDDAALAKALRANQPGAREALYDKYAKHVRGVLVRTLGTNIDLADHLHNVFIEAYSSTHSIRDDKRLKSWLTSITVFTAIAHIRKSSKRKWLVFGAPEDLPQPVAPAVDNEKREAVRLVYEILGNMPVDERIPFSLRIIDDMPLADVASACDVSLATVKRRITKAKERFALYARKYPLLSDMMENGTLWRKQ